MMLRAQLSWKTFTVGDHVTFCWHWLLATRIFLSQNKTNKKKIILSYHTHKEFKIIIFLFLNSIIISSINQLCILLCYIWLCYCSFYSLYREYLLAVCIMITSHHCHPLKIKAFKVYLKLILQLKLHWCLSCWNTTWNVYC